MTQPPAPEETPAPPPPEPHVWARPLQPEFAEDFFRFHDGTDCGPCFCMDWHCAGDGRARDAARSADLRAEKARRIAECGDTGMLLYEDEAPVGWCQFGPRTHFPRLLERLDPPEGPAGLWSLNCLLVRADRRRQGYARVLLAVTMEHLLRMGVHDVEAYPRPGEHPAAALRTGPLQLFLDAGFRIVRPDPERLVVRKSI